MRNTTYIARIGTKEFYEEIKDINLRRLIDTQEKICKERNLELIHIRFAGGKIIIEGKCPKSYKIKACNYLP